MRASHCRYELYHNRSADGFVIEHRVDRMVEEMRKSIFCLAPAGHGWGNRIVYAMVSGCIPLIIQDGIHQPYDDILPCAAGPAADPASCC